MGGDTTLVQRQDFEPLLKPGWRVIVEPRQKYGIFQVPRDQIPEILPPVQVDVLASDFSQTIAALTGSSSDSKNRKITEIDMGKKTLAQYRIVPLDRLISFKVAQPGANFRFSNKAGTIEFNWGTVNWAIKNKVFSMIPELFVFEDQTQVTLYATNMNMDRTATHARCMFLGFRYPLEDAGGDVEGAALTVRVGAIG